MMNELIEDHETEIDEDRNGCGSSMQACMMETHGMLQVYGLSAGWQAAAYERPNTRKGG